MYRIRARTCESKKAHINTVQDEDPVPLAQSGSWTNFYISSGHNILGGLQYINLGYPSFPPPNSVHPHCSLTVLLPVVSGNSGQMSPHKGTEVLQDVHTEPQKEMK